MTDYIKGLDISAIQGSNINYTQLFEQGIKFCIFRCGIGNQSVDKLYISNVAAAKAAGIKVMAYHFIFPLPEDGAHPGRSPQAQAKMHFDAAMGERICVDAEWPDPSKWKQWSCTAKQINQWCLDYLKEYERLDGRKPIVYTYPNYAQNVKFSPEMAQYPLWIASYTKTPKVPGPWTDWAIWQTAGGTLMKLPNGIPVDTNVAKDLSLWDAQAPPAEPFPTNTDTTSSDTVVPPIAATSNVFTKVMSAFTSFFNK